MPKVRDKLQRGRVQRKVWGKLQTELEDTACIGRVRRALDPHIPLEDVALVSPNKKALHRLVLKLMQLVGQQLHCHSSAHVCIR